VPWHDFIGRPGYEGIGLFHDSIRNQPDGPLTYYWRATEDCFMRGNPNYQIPGYHRYLIYKKIMEMAEIADTGGDGYLAAFFTYDSVKNTSVTDWEIELAPYKP